MKAFASSRPERGAVLIVALLLAAIIGVALVSYVNLGRNNLKQAQRTYLGVTAMNLAEAGLESALYSFNQLDGSTGPVAWSGWNTNITYTTASPYPTTAWRTLSTFDTGQNSTGVVKAFVEYPNGSRADGSTSSVTPSILVKATITPDTGPAIERFIRITLHRRGLFANGLVARNDITWVGHPSADSWHSDPDGDGVHVAYPGVGQTANVVVASISGDITLSGGEVWGYAKTGVTGTISGGSVHGLGTTTDDPTRRTNDFDSTFPMPTTPSPTVYRTITSNVTSSRTFPDTSTDSPNPADGKYYYRFAAGAGISLAGSDIVSIASNRDVVFILDNHNGTTAISSGGNAGFDINSHGSLNVYTNGNIAIAGNGFANDNNNPASAIFWGTNSTSQNISISGNGTLTGIVYAPNGTASLNGGGTNGMMQGAVVANSITMNGGTEFHYDDSLANLVVGNIWGISGWRELASGAERTTSTTTPTGVTTTYSALLNF